MQKSLKHKADSVSKPRLGSGSQQTEKTRQIQKRQRKKKKNKRREADKKQNGNERDLVKSNA